MAYPNGFVIDHVLGFCARAGLRYVDLRETFAAVRPASVLWARRLDTHPDGRRTGWRRIRSSRPSETSGRR